MKRFEVLIINCTNFNSMTKLLFTRTLCTIDMERERSHLMILRKSIMDLSPIKTYLSLEMTGEYSWRILLVVFQFRFSWDHFSFLPFQQRLFRARYRSLQAGNQNWKF